MWNTVYRSPFTVYDLNDLNQWTAKPRKAVAMVKEL
jgi:hypothetical protein